MANIQTRKNQNGTVSYRVQVRIRGYPPQHASFRRRTDAKQWAQQTETDIRQEMPDVPRQVLHEPIAVRV